MASSHLSEAGGINIMIYRILERFPSFSNVVIQASKKLMNYSNDAL